MQPNNFLNFQQVTKEPTDQGSDKWHLQRQGMFTGSKAKDLMACDRAASRMEWGRPEKLVSLGDTAIKYIYSRAMEIARKKAPKMPDILAFKYGHTLEPVAAEMLKEKEIDNLEFIKQGFLPVPGHEKYMGASPDGLALIKGEKTGVEIKGAMRWETFYDRTQKAFDQAHIDFWQVQMEALAMDVEKIFYVTAEPAEDAIEFISCDDMQHKKQMIGYLDVKTVYPSPVHQQALTARAQMGHKIVLNYLKKGGYFMDRVREVVSSYDI